MQKQKKKMKKNKERSEIKCKLIQNYMMTYCTKDRVGYMGYHFYLEEYLKSYNKLKEDCSLSNVFRYSQYYLTLDNREKW